ncbi:MAG: GAF domain-containing protein, partial [Chloroflexaceae bacterium]|nr:GAF domain-containing protein [Chloroflexaceae bacterium]
MLDAAALALRSGQIQVVAFRLNEPDDRLFHLKLVPLPDEQVLIVWETDTPSRPPETASPRSPMALAFVGELLAHAPSLAYMLDAAGRYSHVNAHFVSLLDSQPEQIIGLLPTDLFPQEVAYVQMAHDQFVLTIGIGLETEEELPFVTGSHTFLLTRLPCFDEQGRVIAVVVIGTDISAYKQATDRLDQERGHYQMLATDYEQSFLLTNQRLQELHSLRSMMNELLTELDLPLLLQTVMERTIHLLNATGGELALYEADNHTLNILTSINMKGDYTVTRQPADEGLMGRVVLTHTPLLINHYQGWEPKAAGYGSATMQACVLVPLLAGETLVGVLMVGDENPERQFTVADTQLLTLLAQQVTIAIRNAQLYTAAQRRAEEAETLRRAGAAIISSLDRNAVLNQILKQLAVVVPYDSASVQLRNSNVSEIIVVHGFLEPERILGLSFPITPTDPATLIYETGQPCLLADIQLSYPAFRYPLDNTIRGWMGVPITFQNRVIGVITLDSTIPNRFSSNDMRLASAFADQVAIALENARLYDDAYRWSITDPLMGIANRRHFFTRAEEVWDRCRHANQPVTILMLDTDNFKRVNDRYGHVVGDVVLRQVAAICNDVVQP